ncbi:peptide ABC transporter ATP-binding protein [Skermanella stibiiresistens SB22]|uniref:Peptide ABC transporter ATP-binding protein n=1 Tax=Skermanella stibiiresistens SB22 TaxID=1385369 RepID=W9HBF5_9PROT|nr:ATP-binding cassette domain-containing protein [Skermanella stibiiresistens]EWY42071.1 peptide ABC transporter ATP-binding protein [Skermanella stibiiresistens SB22]
MTTPLLEARNLRKVFGGGWSRKPIINAVDGVNLTVDPGETFGIVGESGSGKSTLARLLIGLEKPTSGTVLIDGVEVGRRRSKDLHRKMQFVFQDPSGALNPRKTIAQILEAPLIHLLGMTKADRRRRVEQLMDQVNLRTEFLDRHPHEFSGGQAQRIGIARALAADPRLIILDEPVSALDVSIQAQILALLNRLKAELGLAYIFISHDLAVVEALCDTVAVMNRGRVVEQAPRAVLFGSPQHDYTRTLLASVPSLRDF